MKKKLFLVLILVSLVPLLDFFQPGLPLTHDGQDHVARIANFYQSLTEGNLVPRWAANLNWGYGHPILMFLYPLPSYLASFFHLLSFSLFTSTKIVFGLSFLLSGLFMFLWVKEFWGKEAGLAAAVIYMLAPYRLVDLYVRGAIGECWAFVWPPLICWAALKLVKTRQWRYLVIGSLSLAAMILSHNALSLMFLPIIWGYMVFLLFSSPKKERKLNAFRYALVTIFGFALSAFFWFPAFFEGKYTLRDIVTAGNITGFEPFSRLLWSPWSYGGTGALSVQLGVVQWLSVVLVPFLIWRFFQKKDKIWTFLLFLFGSFWVAIFLLLPASQFLYLKIPLLQKFQFAWRFLSSAIFPPAIFAGGLIFLLPQKKRFLASGLILLAALFLNQNYWQAKDFLQKKEAFFKNPYPGTTDTGESAPRWSVRFMEKFPPAPIEVIDGEAEIEIGKRLSNEHHYQIEVKELTRLVENTLYFPGWQILVDGKPVAVQFHNPAWRGLMIFDLTSGKHQVVARFGETKLRRFANLISLLSGGILGLSIIIKKRKYG